jgi:hypothetical protein
MGRVLYKDTIPYETPSSLDALRGPASGVIELPPMVHWGPKRFRDLDDPGDTVAAYQALVREGTTEVQEELLNGVVLRRVWRDLMLPGRCRDTWESRFPDLSA